MTGCGKVGAAPSSMRIWRIAGLGSAFTAKNSVKPGKAFSVDVGVIVGCGTMGDIEKRGGEGSK